MQVATTRLCICLPHAIPVAIISSSIHLIAFVFFGGMHVFYGMEWTEEQQQLFCDLVLEVAIHQCKASTVPAFALGLAPAYQAAGLPAPSLEWVQNGVPATVGDWLEAALDGQFHHVTKPPRWLDEPHWPFFHGMPMEFVHQFSMPETEVEEAGQIYVFSARRPNEDGHSFTLVYKLVKQTRAGEGTDLLHALDADREE